MWSTASRSSTPNMVEPSEAASRREAASAAVAAQHARLAGVHPVTLFERDPERFEHCSVSAAGLLLDWSRQRIDAAALASLGALAEAAGVPAATESMFRGDRINRTEDRAVLHVALRQPAGAGIGGPVIEAEVLAERARMLAFAESIRTSGEFDDVVHLGIGGSDLGPAMAVQALRHHTGGPGHRAPRVRFAANVDGCALSDILAEADPRRTLFIVVSKTFTTQETLANARTARAWLVEHLGEAAVPAHFAAVSVNAAAMDAFGIHPQRRFMMWDWVGGRYSLWSSVGVSLAIAIGAEHFEQLLAGAHAMDRHFREAPWSRNLPMLMALIGIWNIDCERLPTLAVLPYDSRLARFPAFLQQLDMESNGKRVGLDGHPVTHGTAPVVWGEPGNDAQHSFFQMLHQGTPRAALDILLGLHSSCGREDHQEFAIANALAQAEAFLRGRSGEGVTPHQVHEGGRPHSLLIFDRLDPATLGALVALYEHKVFVQSVVWGINAFDQFGVELGKRIANEVLKKMHPFYGSIVSEPSLRGVLDYVRAGRRGVR
jgi:glucose-6-phosphate isomerase